MRVMIKKPIPHFYYILKTMHKKFYKILKSNSTKFNLKYKTKVNLKSKLMNLFKKYSKVKLDKT